MLRNFNIRVQPRVRFLEEEQLDEIHQATLEILERTGIVVHEKETLELLAGAGCSISEKNRVRIPPHLVEEALRSVSKKCTLSYRNGSRHLFLEDRKSYWGTGSDTPYILDSFTGERRHHASQGCRAGFATGRRSRKFRFPDVYGGRPRTSSDHCRQTPLCHDGFQYGQTHRLHRLFEREFTGHL